ncbi:hypothetical protein GmHk_07G019601 [Glycine max]|nr:hypothetical protein GmHk_07G019601 [Glycine max]
MLERNISDHCPFLLGDPTSNWGSKPFRVLDCWFLHKGFTNGWWGAYVLKEKLKILRGKLKEWNEEKAIDKEMADLDKKNEEGLLKEGDIVTRKALQVEIWRVISSNDSLL